MLNRSYIKGHKGHPHYHTDSKISSLKKNVKLSGDEEQLLKIIKNLSDPTKLKIYLILHKVEEIPVTDLVQVLGLTQSTVSHTLADLKNLGLVQSHRCGLLICYSLSNGKKKNEKASPYYINKFLGFLNKFK